LITTLQRLLISAILLILVVAVRAPFLTQPLVAEEATFAMLLTGNNVDTVPVEVNPVAGLRTQCLLPSAKLGGVDYVFAPERNIVPYCFLTMVVNPVTKYFFTDSLSFNQKSFHIRIIFFLLFLVGFLSVLLVLFFSQKSSTKRSYLLLNILLLFFFTTPLLVGGSIQAQLEGSFGVALFGLSGLLSYWGAYKFKKTSYIFIFIAGALLSLCKNEWPLTALSAALTYILISCISRVKAILDPDNKKQIHIAIIYMIGLLSGMLFCYLFSPKDYVAGYVFMKDISGARMSIFALIEAVGHLIYPAAIIVALAGFIFICNLKNHLKQGSILFIWITTGIALFAGFLYSGWIGDGFPRYFVPSIISLLLFLFLTLPYLSKDKMNYLIGFLLIGVCVNLYSLTRSKLNSESITSVPGLRLDSMQATMKALADKNIENPNLIPFGYFGSRYYFPEADIISNGFGLSGAKFIIEKFGNKNMTIIESSH
jgi:hypothetical protein